MITPAIQRRSRRNSVRFGFVLRIAGKRRSFFRATTQAEAERERAKELVRWSIAVHAVNG